MANKSEQLAGGDVTAIAKSLEGVIEKTFHNLLHDDLAYTHAANAAHNYVLQKTGATGKVLQFIQEKRLLTS